MTGYVVCCNGTYDVVYGEYVLETYINDWIDEGYKPDDIMVFDIDSEIH